MAILALQSTAQQVSSDLSEDIMLYAEINMENIRQKANLETIKENIIWNKLAKFAFGRDSIDVDITGLDISKNHRFFLTNSDNVFSTNVSLVIKDVVAFESFIQSCNITGRHNEIENTGSYSSFSIDQNTFVAWNNAIAYVMKGSYRPSAVTDFTNMPYDDEESYEEEEIYDEGEVEDVQADVEEAIIDSAAYIFDYEAEITYLESIIVENEEYIKSLELDIKQSVENIGTYRNDIEYLKKYHEYPPQAPIAETEEVTEETTEEDDMPLTFQEEAQNEYVEEITTEVYFDEETFQILKTYSDLKFEQLFSAASPTVFFSNFQTKKDPLADVYIQADYNEFFTNLKKLSGGNPALNNPGLAYLNMFSDLMKTNYAANIYFREKSIESKMYTLVANQELKNDLIKMYDPKFDKSLAKYNRSSDLAMYSFSLDSKAYLDFFLNIDKYGVDEEGSSVKGIMGFVFETMRVAFDEKALSDLMTGKGMFILHELESREVSYIDYQYNADDTMTEVEKTRSTVNPGFTFVVKTRNDGYWARYFDMMGRSMMGNLEINRVKDFYMLNLGENSPVESLFFGVHKGEVVLSTNQQDIDILFGYEKGGSSAQLKKYLKKHPNSGEMKVSELAHAVYNELKFNDSGDNQLKNYLLNNLGNVKYRNDVVNNEFVSQLDYEIKEGWPNSLQYLFDMLETLITMEKKNE